MEEVRQLVQEEGREARNLVAFHVAVDTPARVARKPPRSAAAPPPRRAPPRAARLRSASAGRDKRSELRARYWALLFGDLQRAIGEIYNTVEAHENLNECQEVILVLENYTRDFKALGEWFRLKWEYDNTPPPQRPQSLAWEIRKTDFVRPESRRTHSVKSSPSVSGKNSPCLSGHNTPSGKNSPNLTGKASPGSGKISPRVSSGHSNTSPKANIEFFSSKLATSKITAKPEPKASKEVSRLSDIKEKDIKEIPEDNDSKDSTNIKDEKCGKEEIKQTPAVEIGKAKECPNICPKQVVIKSPKHLNKSSLDNSQKPCEDLSSQAKLTVAQLDAMENEFLTKQLTDNKIKNENMLNQDKDLEMSAGNVELPKDDSEKIAEDIATIDIKDSEDNFADVSNEISCKSNDEAPLSTIANVTDSSETPEVTPKTDTAEIAKDTLEDSKVELGKDTEKNNNTEVVKDIVKEVGQTNKDSTDVKDDTKRDDTKKSESKTSDTRPSTRPAYSQAAAKPKQVTATKTEMKTPTRSTPLVRSKTVIEIRPNSSTVPKTQKQFPKKNQANKCSYPFNLTTGRTSLFDTASSNSVSRGAVPKKTLSRNVQMGSGDTKPSQTKVDLKKQPPRPMSLKITEKGDNKEKLNPTLEKIKDCEEYSSSDTIVTQIDMSRIESSESLKTLVPEELQMILDVANSVEVLNVDSNKSDNEGWLTVKSRRLSRESKKQSKSHWATRFHQPSATTSLPTLNMMESPSQEVKPLVNSPKNAKSERAKSEQPQNIDKPEKAIKVKPKSVNKTSDPTMIRQKSDVTGLKTRSSRSKALTKKTDKFKDTALDDDGSELTKNRLHSSLESLTMGLARSQESTEEAFDFDKWKAEFKSTFKFLEEEEQIPNHNEILKTADPSEMSEIAEMTSQIEENERKISWALDLQSEVDQRKLCEEEDLLNRQIMELQQVSDIDLDTETDDTETDAEILCEDNAVAGPSCGSPESLGAYAASLEDQYETALAGMSWAERVDTLVVLEALVARDPGRAQQLHAKLSQGIKRRGSFQDALRRLQAKQARAERQRQEYQTERARKIHQLLARVEEVKVAKNQLIEEKRIRMERRLQKAAENRDQHLKDIVRKAHDEEEKLREIAFIKQLEAENRRHEFLDQCRSHTTRLRQMRRDRLRKLEQKAAREAAVGARRQALEAARKLHVETLLEKRKERDARVEELKEQKKQERDDAAREKAEGVKSRLSALAAAAELEARALRRRIRHKQTASQQRLQSHLQAIREKATGPRQPTTSESQDQSTKDIDEETERLEQERKEREKQKAIKKKARKIKQKLLSTGNENAVFEDNATHLIPFETLFHSVTSKMSKVIQHINNIITPLLDSENKDDNSKRNDLNQFNSDIDDIDKINKKNKNKNNKNKMVNGDVDNENSGEKKKRKKKNGEDKTAGGDKNIDNNNDKPKEKEAENNNNTEIIKVDAQEPEMEPVKTENNKKKNKKNKNKDQNENNTKSNDKSKLSKTSSVCSSLSDMSKASSKNERKARVVIDTPFLERQLNELHRMMEKFDKNAPDKVMFQKVHGLRALGQLLAVAAERDLLAAQLTPRLLTTAVTVVSRVVGACSVSAAYFISTNTCVHIVKLLSNQLEKDLHSDQKEMELAKQLSDCLSVTLDAVLCSTRLYEERKELVNDEVEFLSTLRNRAHTLISYLCLCGCINRAEKAGEARESIQTLLTVCADLCHPCDVDVGTERASATQSLRCALGNGLCGSRAELCGLFAGGAGGVGAAGAAGVSLVGLANIARGFVRAARTAHLLRALAELDHHIVQEAFGEGGWPLEFRAAVARLLSQHAPNDKEAPRTSTMRVSDLRLDQTLSETLVLDLIVLVGFVVVNNPGLQETICEGWSVIKTLCTLPANWLVSPDHSYALLPTLVALSEWPSAAAAISSELSMDILEECLDSPEAQKVRLVQVIKQGRAKKATGKK